MKVAIISDTHNNLSNLEKFLSFIRKKGVEIIIHCGDVCGSETIRKLEEGFNSQIYLSLGNADLKEKIKNDVFKKTELFESYGEIKIEGLKIAFCHDPSLAEKLSKTKKYDFIFYGHTHKPSLKSQNNSFLTNPGNLAGLIYKATFALLDTETKNLSLKILEEI